MAKGNLKPQKLILNEHSPVKRLPFISMLTSSSLINTVDGPSTGADKRRPSFASSERGSSKQKR